MNLKKWYVQAIFGAPTLNNSTIVIRGDEVWNEKFIRRFTPPGK